MLLSMAPHPSQLGKAALLILGLKSTRLGAAMGKGRNQENVEQYHMESASHTRLRIIFIVGITFPSCI